MNDVIMMSLGLYSNVWLGLIIIGTQVVERLTRTFGVESLALTKTVQTPSFMSIGTMAIELRVFKKKRKKKKTHLVLFY